MPKDHEFEIKLIKTVEQYPCLYNFRLPEYSRREVNGAAWEKESKEMNATVQECKNKWRTQRIKYTRAIKYPPSGSSAKKLTQKTKDMIKEMDYIRCYVNAKGSQELPSNLPPLASPDNQDEMSQEIAETDVESADRANIITVENSQLISSVVQPPVEKLKTPRYSNDTTDSIDAHVLQNIKSKQQREPENPKRLFLLSLLPDLEQMNYIQMRNFRRKVNDLIDEVLSSDYGPPPSRPPSTSSWRTEHSQSSASTNFQEHTSTQPWLVNTLENTYPLQTNSEKHSLDQHTWFDR